jgi:hypothetical protein
LYNTIHARITKTLLADVSFTTIHRMNKAIDHSRLMGRAIQNISDNILILFGFGSDRVGYGK